MTQNNPKIGEVWNLGTKPKVGTRTVEVVGTKGGKFTVAFGRLAQADGDEPSAFLRKSYASPDGGGAVRTIEVGRADFAEFVTKLENVMASKKQNATEAENADNPGGLTYEMDDDAATQPEGDAAPKKTKMTAKEKAAAILKAEKDKEKAAAEKQKAKDKAAEDKKKQKAKEAAEKRAAGLKDLAEKAGVKEAEEVVKYNPEAKKWVDLTEEQANLAKAALKDAVKAKTKADALALKTNLTDEEAKERVGFEKIVEKNLNDFQKASFQIGGALTAINQKRLYRNTHKTFEDYVMERFGLSKPHAYSVMNAAVTFTALTEGEAVDLKSLPSITAADAITRGVRGLLKEGGMADNPEVEAISRQLARNAYQLAVQNAPVDKDGAPILSPDHIASTFGVLNEVAKAGVVTVDGKNIPINLAAASIDEMITTESKERSDRMRQTLSERIQKAKEATVENRKGKLDAALSNATTGNGAAIPEGVEPRLSAACSVHGRVEVSDTTDTDLTLGCGCVFVNTAEGFKFEKNKKAAKAGK